MLLSKKPNLTPRELKNLIFVLDVINEIIMEAKRRSGRQDALTLKLRDLDARPRVQRIPVPDRKVGVLAGLDGPHPLLQPQMLGGSSLALRV